MNSTLPSTIKNTTWSVAALVVLLGVLGVITKPKFQRKLKWSVLPKSGASMREFIDFLFRVKNTVHPISFSQKCIDSKIVYENIDGNNRINAIWRFMTRPFDIYPEYLDEIIARIEAQPSLSETDKHNLVEFCRQLSYKKISGFRRGSDLYESMPEIAAIFEKLSLRVGRELEDDFIAIQKKLLFANGTSFDTAVQININVFENATNAEICKVFSDINTYSGNLSASELLASTLYTTQIVIHDRDYDYALRKEIQMYYATKNEKGEILSGFIIPDEQIHTFEMNGFDFFVGIQNYCSRKYPHTIVPYQAEQNTAVSICIRLYALLYGKELTEQNVNTANVNVFLAKTIRAVQILHEVIDDIFPRNVDETLFNKQGKRESSGLCSTKTYLLLSAIVGYMETSTPETKIKTNVKCAMLYNYIVSEIDSANDQIELFRKHNAICISKRDHRSDEYARSMMDKPDNLVSGPTKDRMREVVEVAVNGLSTPDVVDVAKPAGLRKTKGSRRKLTLVDRLLTSAFFRMHVSHSLLDKHKSFSNEHVVPFSSVWAATEMNINIDRLGNLVPMMAGANKGRGNGSVSYYEKTVPKYISFFPHMLSTKIYSEMVKYDKKTPIIQNPGKYNAFCETNEAKYIETFLESVYGTP